MVEQVLNKKAIDWARTSTPQELKAKLVKHLTDSLNADHTAIFALNYAQDRLVCEHPYPSLYMDQEIEIALDDNASSKDDPIVWTLRSGQDLFLTDNLSFRQFSVKILNKIWQNSIDFCNAYFLCMSQSATSPDTVIVILSQNPIHKKDIDKQKDYIRLAEGLLANIFSRLKSEQNLKSALIQNEKQKTRIDKIFDNKSLLAGSFVFQSQEMKNIHDELKKVANTHMTVCLLGETGVGKDVAASELHRMSERSHEPFVAINCAAIPSELLESELFGYRKGAHSNAHKDYDGLFIQAGAGTIFLDEIAELSENLQARLLRILQNKTVRPLGAEREYRLNCRIITATNQNIQEKIKAKLLRADLYYRLSQFIIDIPPLRDRKEDILPLSQYFIRDVNQKEQLFIRGISDDAIKCLQKKDFNGNIRELRHIIERAALEVPSGGIIEAKHLKDNKIQLNKKSEEKKDFNFKVYDELSYNNALVTFHVELLQRRLKSFNGKKSEAAKSLDLPIRTFYEKCRKFNLSE